ncbi:MAG TPA: sulfite exporter TauE/SafE family protein [Myxococcota bacterium]|nr:sulfite exporter TauE/SafE family protein [Myxococcota bacterium]
MSEILGFAASVAIGLSLGFFGGGGSILTVPLLVYGFGLDAKPAIASSLLIVAGASAVGTLQHARAGNVEARTALGFGAAGMAGAYAGGLAGTRLDDALLLLLFAAMMLLASIAMWRGRRLPATAPEGRDATVRHVAHGFGVGLFSGLVGAGGGFLIVPALVLWSGLPIARAVGTSLLIICLQCLAAFAGYASRVEVDYPLVAGITLGAVLGSLPGAWLARRVDPASFRRAFSVFVVAMAGFVLVREADVWLETARSSLPRSSPQIVFALFVLGIGIAAGRLTRRASSDPFAERLFREGAGI